MVKFNLVGRSENFDVITMEISPSFMADTIILFFFTLLLYLINSRSLIISIFRSEFLNPSSHPKALIGMPSTKNSDPTLIC
jgi:uncharacterized membrane protein